MEMVLRCWIKIIPFERVKSWQMQRPLISEPGGWGTRVDAAHVLRLVNPPHQPAVLHRVLVQGMPLLTGKPYGGQERSGHTGGKVPVGKRSGLDAL